MRTYKETGADTVKRDDGVFVPKTSDEYLDWLAAGNTPLPADPIVPAIPNRVTMRQARLALLQLNLLGQVNAAVAAADEATKITWEFSSEVHRSHPFVENLAAALNLSEAQLDNLFTLAATL